MAVYLSISIAQNSQSVANNTSNVTVKVNARWDYGSYNRLEKSGTLTIDGTTYTFLSSFNYNATTTGSETLFSYTVNVEHDNEGKKLLSCSATYATGGNSGTVTASASKALTTIPRQANITSAPNFNDEANPVIKYSNPAGNSVSSLQACIANTDGVTIYAAYRNISKTGSSYTFTLTDAERTALRNACANANSMSVRFYVKTVIGGNTYLSRSTKTLSIVNATPTLSPSVVDTNATTIALTGDSNKLVKYFSNAKVAFGASALKGATIKSRKVECGSKSLSADGTISAVESGTFKFTVTDSRGNSKTQTVTKSLVNYVKLTCGLANTEFNTDGVISFTVKGNSFKGSFGTTDNTLAVQYRYKVSGGTYSDWTTTEATISTSTYSANVTISGLDYQKKYVIQARATDKLATATTSAKTMSCVPVFDWSADEFNFNVPVQLSHGGYYYSLLGLFRAMTTTYTLPCEVTVGSNYSSASVTAHLTGCNLRIGLSAVRNAAATVGNVTNETVATILINHGGKLDALYRVSFNSSTEGGVAAFDAQAYVVDDNTIKVTITLCATTTAATGWNAYFAMPCTLKTYGYV